MKISNTYILTILICAMSLIASCSSSYKELDVTSEDEVSDDSTTLSKGFDSFSFELPAVSRFMGLVEESEDGEIDIEFYMRGRTINEEYSVLATMRVVEDLICIKSEDRASLAQLPHQEYFLNYMIKSGATRSTEEVIYPEGAVVIGALLSAEDSDNIYLMSSISEDSAVSGVGSKSDPYIIATVDHFKEYVVNKMHNEKSDLSGVYYLQSADLNFFNESVENIGVVSEIDFAGHYDGGMMRMEQLTINSDSEKGAGLFYGLASEGVFCNVVFVKTTVTGLDNVGLVASHSSGGQILHVIVDSGCTVSGSGDNVGGFVGNGYGTISGSVFRGSVIGGDCCGGFIGYVGELNGSKLLMKNVTFSGSVKSLGSYSGGALGRASNFSNIQIDGVYVSGTISVADNYIGGLIGRVESVSHLDIDDVNVGYTRTLTDDDSYIVGSPYASSISIEDNDLSTTLSYVGGLVGHITGVEGDNSYSVSIGDSCLTSSANDVLTGYTYVGGVAGYAEYVTFRDCSFTNDLDVVATIANSSYSYYYSYVGGAFGYVGHSAFLSDNSFINRGAISGSCAYVGGVIGSFEYVQEDSSQDLKLSNYGVVTSSNDKIGGCVGYLYNTLYHSTPRFITYVNYGSVSGDDYIGGFIGYCSGHPAMRDIYDVHLNGYGDDRYNVVISGDTYVGGMIGGNTLYGTTSTSSLYVSIYGRQNISIIAGSCSGGFIGDLHLYNQYMPSAEITESFIVSIKESDSNVVLMGSDRIGGVIGYVHAYNLKEGVAQFYLKVSTGSALSESSVITGTGEGVGGVVGEFYGKDDDNLDVTFSHCYNKAEVTTNAMGLGGILGKMDAESKSDVAFEYCCNWGAIKSVATDSRVGGIIGYSDEGDNVFLTACYNGGDITGSDHRGGLIGRTEQRTYVSNCFNMGSVPSGGLSVGGLIGSIERGGNNDKIDFNHCYNIGSTGWGTIGGEEGLGDSDCNNDYTYYLNTASSGDIDISKYDNAESLTARQMADGVMNLDATYFATPSDMKTSGYLPYIKDITYYKSKPKVSL